MDYTATEFVKVSEDSQTFTENGSDMHWYDMMVADYDYQTPEVGQILQGEITRIDEDALLVDVGLKRTAIVTSRDLSRLSSDIVENLSVGDPITVYVLRKPDGDKDLLVSLNKGLEFQYWEEAERHLQEGTVLDLPITGYNRGGLLVKFENLRGFLPFSQVPALRSIRDRSRADELKKEMVGSSVAVKVIEVNPDRNRLIFSASKAEHERSKERLEELEVGQIIRGPIVNIVKFGVFVNLDGIDGLVHISRLSWERINHPSDRFEVGEEIDVKVIEVDAERERISLDHKCLLPSPWEQFAEMNQIGDTLQGRVTKVLDFGAFVELLPGLEGLVHVSEIGYSSTGQAQDVVRAGDRVLVRVLRIEPERERISLSMRQVPLEAQIAWSLEHEDYQAVPTAEEEPESNFEEPGEETQPVESEAEEAETVSEIAS